MTENRRPVPARPSGSANGTRPANRPQARPNGAQRPAQARPQASRPQARPAQARPSGTPRPAAQRPANRASARGYVLPYDFWKVLIVGVIAIALAFGAQMIWPNGFSVEEKKAETTESTQTTSAGKVQEIHSSGPIRINELMSCNDTTLLSEAGKTPDWIEIMNISNHEVNLAGYSLAKSEKATNVFTFPNCTLAAGESVIVYADSTLENAAGSEFHAPFRLSSAGGSLMLFSTSGTAIDSVNFPALGADISYVRLDQTTWAMSDQPTPGLSNTESSYQQLNQARTDTGIEITEIVASNTQYAADENGLYQDYFEIHNTSNAAVDLSNWCASDDPEKPNAWRFPEGFVLQPGEYRIVYASGLNRADATNPHTNFGLSPEGETLTISDANSRLVDSVSYDLLKTDQAWVKHSDGSWSTGTPSPNAAND